MSGFDNGLTKAQAERLAVLAEEAAEVGQMVGKILRHGYESHHPMGGPTNRRLLEKELGDLQFAVQLCIDGGDVDGEAVSAAEVDKGFRIVPYLHHNKYLITGVDEDGEGQ